MVKNNFLKNYFHNLKNAKKNLEIVRSSPVASLKYRYTMQRAMVVLLCLYFVYQFINIIIKYNGGSSAMTLMGRGIILLILVIIIVKSIETLKPLKNALAHYEANPQHNVYKRIDVKAEIDDILNKFEENERRSKK